MEGGVVSESRCPRVHDNTPMCRRGGFYGTGFSDYGIRSHHYKQPSTASRPPRSLAERAKATECEVKLS